VFRQRIPPPVFKVLPHGTERMTVKPETALVRPFVVCAVLRGVTFDKVRYNSFIDLQDKLHQNLCRQRSLVAIGTHDLDKVQGPFTYEALPPEEIRFVPLKQEREFNARELLDHYDANDLKLRKFTPLIKSSQVYPVIYDANRTVLSLPPVINGQQSAISLDTKNVFIECTATDLHKANMVLNTVVTMFSEYCAAPFEIEPVTVTNAMGEEASYPKLEDKEFQVSCDFITGLIGAQIAPEKQAELLTKMQLSAAVLPGGKTIHVSVPPTRSDILHAVDIAEDVGIAYGYNNIEWTVPKTVTIGRELPLNQLTELLRLECAQAGFTENLTWALCSKMENFDLLRRKDDGSQAVSIGNPATAEFEIVRTDLLPAALKTLGANTDAPLPLRLFEISDVMRLTDEREVGAKNQRRLVAAYASNEASFESIHGLLNRLMETLGVPCTHPCAGEEPSDRMGGYTWEKVDDAESEQSPFFQGRHGRILFHGPGAAGPVAIGDFGVVHPDVLAGFGIPVPVSAVEFNVEPFCRDQYGKSLLQEWK